MTDRELLELAAKAAGYKLNAFLMENRAIACPDAIALALSDPWNNWWNPLTDDGDVARLEAACEIDIEWHSIGVIASINSLDDSRFLRVREPYADHGGDKQKARRFASVRLAAEIGKAMP